jgi:hypothetical protein
MFDRSIFLVTAFLPGPQSLDILTTVSFMPLLEIMSHLLFADECVYTAFRVRRLPPTVLLQSKGSQLAFIYCCDFVFGARHYVEAKDMIFGVVAISGCDLAAHCLVNCVVKLLVIRIRSRSRERISVIC